MCAAVPAVSEELFGQDARTEETIRRTGAVDTKSETVGQPNKEGKTGKSSRKLRTAFLSCMAAAVAALLIGSIWTYYYDLNDDSLMAEILAGSYTGTVELRNIQSYFPLTAVLGGLYRLAGRADWYGLFLLVCQYGSLALVLGRALRWSSIGADAPEGSADSQKGGPRGKKSAWLRGTGAVLLVFLAAAGLLLYHFVFLQYSVTVGMIGAAAAFWFLTMEPAGSLRGWAAEILPPVLLIALGYLLRSEMMIFIGPFVAFAFLIRALELPIGRRKKFRLMGIVLVLVLAVLGLGEFGNRLGYRSADWKEFNRFFDARTQLYDFQKIPDYEENESFYESIGLDRQEAELIRNYNFGLDGDIDAEKLEALASYAKGKAAGKKSTGTRLKEALWDYRASMTVNAEEPYRMISLVLYVGALVLSVIGFWEKSEKAPAGEDEKKSGTSIKNENAGNRSGIPSKGGNTKEKGQRKRGSFLMQTGWILVLFSLRSALLLYLYYNHRPVVRLTHSIYLAEAVILLWMIAGTVRGKRKEGAAVFSLLALMFLAAAGMQVRDIAQEQKARLVRNAPYEELLDYCREHSENVYFTDVYSTVDFSDPLFTAVGRPVNYDLMGGWASKSPLEREKLENLGLLPEKSGVSAVSAENSVEGENSAEEADAGQDAGSPALDEILRNHPNVYVAAEAEADLSWLAQYYVAKGQEVSVKEADRIGNDWVIYSVE